MCASGKERLGSGRKAGMGRETMRRRGGRGTSMLLLAMLEQKLHRGVA